MSVANGKRDKGQLQQSCQINQERQVRSSRSKSLLCQDVHDLPAKRVELLNLSIGRFGHLLGKEEEDVHLDEHNRLQTRIFHHLVYLNQGGEDWMRGTIEVQDAFNQ